MKVCIGMFGIFSVGGSAARKLFYTKLRNEGVAIAVDVPSAMRYFSWTISAWEAKFLREDPSL